MQTLKPTIWIGKKGLSEEAIVEIQRQLEAGKPVKVRFLRGVDMDPGDLADRSGGKLLGIRGRTVVLEKSR